MVWLSFSFDSLLDLYMFINDFDSGIIIIFITHITIIFRIGNLRVKMC